MPDKRKGMEIWDRFVRAMLGNDRRNERWIGKPAESESWRE